MILRQLFDPRSSTYTYLLADEQTREALYIDPVFEQYARDAALLSELGLTLRFTLETHVHADHVTAAWLFHERLGSRIVVGRGSGAEGADRRVDPGDVVSVGEVALEARATPGHTTGCVSWISRDRRLAFTGDALMIRSAGRTDFQGGDARTLFRSVREQLFSLPDDCAVYPGHDYQGRTMSTIGEERAHNPRLGGDRNEEDFAGTMANLGLPHPRQIDVAVLANLRCGRPDGPIPPAAPAWAPVVRSFAGVPQIAPEWAFEHAGEVFLLDVREPGEWSGELGHLAGATLVPLGELRARLGELPRERPIVVYCRSGGRSAQASLILEGAGFAQVANLDGGMVRWRSLRLPSVRA